MNRTRLALGWLVAAVLVVGCEKPPAETSAPKPDRPPPDVSQAKPALDQLAGQIRERIAKHDKGQWRGLPAGANPDSGSATPRVAHSYALRSHEINQAALERGEVVGAIGVQHTVTNLDHDNRVRFLHDQYRDYKVVRGGALEEKTRVLEAYYKWDGARWVFDPTDRSKAHQRFLQPNGRGYGAEIPYQTGVQNITRIVFPFGE